ANAIVIRSIERHGSSRLALLESIVGEESVFHSVELDAVTFVALERVFQTHPFRRKRPEDDVVLFKSLNTPLGTDNQHVGLLIVNHGSRHHYLQIEVLAAVFRRMKAVLQNWSARFDKRFRRGRAPAWRWRLRRRVRLWRESIRNAVSKWR